MPLHIPSFICNIKINPFMNQLFLLSSPLSQPNGYRQYQSQHTEVLVVFTCAVFRRNKKTTYRYRHKLTDANMIQNYGHPFVWAEGLSFLCNSFQTYQDLKENPGIFCFKNCRTQVIHILKFLILYIFLSKICSFEAEVCWQLAKVNLGNWVSPIPYLLIHKTNTRFSNYFRQL